MTMSPYGNLFLPDILYLLSTQIQIPMIIHRLRNIIFAEIGTAPAVSGWSSKVYKNTKMDSRASFRFRANLQIKD